MSTSIFISRVNNFYFFLLCLYAFFIPTFNNFTTPIIILLLVLTIIDIKGLQKFWLTERNIIIIGLPLVFLLSSISLFYSQKFGAGTKLVFRILPLLLFPLILHKVSGLNNKQVKTVFRYFVFGCLLTICYSYLYVVYEAIDGSYKRLHLPENHLAYFLNRLTYQDLVSKNIVDHSIYFGAYVLLAFTIVKSNKELFTSKIRKSILYLFVVTLVLLTPVIIAISGLIVFTIFFIVQNRENKTNINRLKLLKTNALWSFIVFYLFVWKIQPHLEFIYVFNNLKYNLIIAGGISVSIALGQVAYSIYSFRRLKLCIVLVLCGFGILLIGLFIFPFDRNSHNLSNYTARMVNNYASVQVLKDHFLFGVGIGDVQDNLVSIYKELRFRKTQFNEHNQYLRFWLGSGVLTFLIFAFWLLKTMTKSVKYKNPLMICISFTLFLFCFTESVLVRQMGISFFIFFIFFLYYSQPLKARENEN